MKFTSTELDLLYETLSTRGLHLSDRTKQVLPYFFLQYGILKQYQKRINLFYNGTKQNVQKQITQTKNTLIYSTLYCTFALTSRTLKYLILFRLSSFVNFIV
jgi:hypothetical protein